MKGLKVEKKKSNPTRYVKLKEKDGYVYEYVYDKPKPPRKLLEIRKGRIKW